MENSTRTEFLSLYENLNPIDRVFIKAILTGSNPREILGEYFHYLRENDPRKLDRINQILRGNGYGTKKA